MKSQEINQLEKDFTNLLVDWLQDKPHISNVAVLALRVVLDETIQRHNQLIKDADTTSN